MSSDSTTVTAPRQVSTAYRLYVASAIVALVGFVVSLFLVPAAIDAAVNQVQAQSSGTNGVDVRAVATGAAIGGLVFAGIIAVAFFVLTLVFAGKMRQGRNWARVVLAVFAGLHVLGLFALATGTTPVVSALLSVVVAVLSVAAAVLTFLREPNAWFQQQKAVRTNAPAAV